MNYINEKKSPKSSKSRNTFFGRHSGILQDQQQNSNEDVNPDRGEQTQKQLMYFKKKQIRSQALAQKAQKAEVKQCMMKDLF